ncbi:DUF4123 domain-containing protein [Halomonas huangheensis]|uniref:DUF4123 domain-containing protein n=1 Tax=Halomonas huangheensis TaxID=1178482 RepID=W1N4V6_9GAMM|nr:DUF4123 domain-containing protein [Halomonas huangheensis]ALM52009.1 hypothetical protein AR456_06745 [Halomonas huangheensis]ERL50558.1 hypothetical protein BJB45_05370 [Halomonas huangheensis]
MDRAVSPEPLLAWLDRRERADSLYCLINPANGSDRALTTAQLEQCGVIGNPFFDDPLAKRMYLKPVPMTASELRASVSREFKSLPDSRIQPVAFCGWIATRADLRSVVSYMQRQLTVMSPQGKACLLRFHDPRVLERLEYILDPLQLSRLLGPIDSWWYFNHRQQLKELSPHQEQRGLGRLRLTEEQWFAIKRIADINHILELWNSMGVENGYFASPADIDQLMGAAEGYGLHEYDDISLFAIHGLLTGKEFHQHPRIQRLLRSMSGERDYSMVTECLEDEDWELIARECRENVHVRHI